MWQRIVFLSQLLLLSSSDAFVTPSSGHRTSLVSMNAESQNNNNNNNNNNLVASTMVATSLAVAVAFQPLVPAANAYFASDYASETVTLVVKSLNEASGDSEGTFKAYETIAAIITEGKGVGGSVNYREYCTYYIQIYRGEGIYRRIDISRASTNTYIIALDLCYFAVFDIL
jgi:hypothetical protein